MLSINPDLPKIKAALNEHETGLLLKIEKAFDKSEASYTSKQFLSKHILPKVNDLLIKKPEDLLKISEEIKKKIASKSKTQQDEIEKEIKRIFSYKNFCTKDKKEYNAYNLAANLDIQTCVYCNRLYTKTVTKGKNKITRPQFDHWFSQKKHPILALSFFNLIPSCSVCNSTVKGSKKMNLTKHLHPYVNDENDINITFSYRLTSYNKHEFSVSGTDKKSENTIKFFKLKEIYETHEDEIRDLIEIKRHYGTNYLMSLEKILGSTINKSDLYRLAFGVYIEESNFEKRPLSRMKKDLLKELGII